MAEPPPLRDEYLEQCHQFGGGSINQETWQELRLLLGGRTNGWRFEVINPDFDPAAAWCFGLAGAARLVVTVELAHVVLYRSDLDDDQHFQTVSGLAAWLDENEKDHEGLTSLQKECIDYLLPFVVEKWTDEQP